MGDQSHGIVVGTIASIVLTPLVMWIWKRIAPPTLRVELDSEARQRSASLSKEAMIAPFAILFTWASIKGFGSPVDRLEVVIAMCTFLGAPLWWVLLRTHLRGDGALLEYAAYFEGDQHISFRSICVLSSLATVVALACLCISLFG